MTPDAIPDVSAVATLSPNGAKARFGAAYMRAICSHAGFGFIETSPDEDVLAVDGLVNFDVGDARVQIKCTGQFRINGGATASWPAEPEWRHKWRKSKTPVYFVIVLVDPDDQTSWLDHLDDGTLCRAAAYWVRVDKMPETPSVTVPRVQRLTRATLATWAAEVDASFADQVVSDQRAS